MATATAPTTSETEAQRLRFRRSATQLTSSQLSTLRSAFSSVYAINDDRGYAYWAEIHGLPVPIGCDNAHGTPYFLPWHRAYLYFFERALRDQVPEAMLSWWDWRRSPGAAFPAAYADRSLSGGGANPLYSARVSDIALRQGRASRLGLSGRTSRQPGAARLLPTAQEVEEALNRSDFLDFTQSVEDIHNRIHVWVGGHMGQVPYAAFDPIFWAHHTMVDRIWRLWQLRHSGGRPPADIIDDALPPFRMTVRETLDVTALGYEYASSTAAATA